MAAQCVEFANLAMAVKEWENSMLQLGQKLLVPDVLKREKCCHIKHVPEQTLLVSLSCKVMTLN